MYLLAATMSVVPTGASFGRASNTTSLLREMAKNKSTVVFAVSGPQAQAAAQLLKTDLLALTENHRTPDEVEILDLATANNRIVTPAPTTGKKKPPKPKDNNWVAILAGKEMTGEIPSALASRLSVIASEVQGTVSTIRANAYKSPLGDTAVLGVMYAPDGARLLRMCPLMKQTASDFKLLDLRQQFITNKALVYSNPEEKTALLKWGVLGQKGETIWNQVEWHDLAERATATPEQLDEATEVYFSVRDRDKESLPEPAKTLLASQGPSDKPSCVRVATGTTPDNRKLLAVCAPSSLILQSKIRRFPNADLLSQAPPQLDVADLRQYSSMTVLVTGSVALSPEDRRYIKTGMIKKLRDMKLDITDDSLTSALQEQVTLDQLTGASNTGAALRKKIGARYVWVVDVGDFNGSTSFGHREVCRTPEPSAFSKIMPLRPTQGRKQSDGDYRNDLQRYYDDKQSYEDEKEEYTRAYTQTAVQWERSVNCAQRATLRGQLQLVDIRPNEKNRTYAVIWQSACSGSGSSDTVFRSDAVTVQGFGNSAQSMDVPSSTSQCETGVMRLAVDDGVKDGADKLQEEAWLPDRAAPRHDDPVPPPPHPDDSVVAAVDVQAQSIVVALGDEVKAKKGGLFVIPMAYKEIKDPRTGKVIKRTVSDKITLRVTQVEGASADCVAATPADARRLGELKEGMKALWRPSKPTNEIKTTPVEPKKLPAPPRKRGRRG